MGDDPRVTAVLLTADARTARHRLARREIRTALDHHAARSDRTARELAELSPGWVRWIATDDRPVPELAAEVITLTAGPRSGKLS